MGHVDRYGRRSIRLRGYDYTADGAHFVTLCTHGRARVFGAVVNGEMRLNACGLEVARCWLWLAERYPYVHLDQWTVMPDHIHGIIVITNNTNVTYSDGPRRGGSRTAQIPTASLKWSADGSTGAINRFGIVPAKRKPLGRLIAAFKTVSTKRVNDLRCTPGARLWQRNYYERIVRDDLSLSYIRRYIVNNPSS